jgi:NTP pyrophosphatase (non-canonical NTP hydrolase)
MIRESESIVDYLEMIKEWHHDRNLIHGATDKDQVCKLIQEVGELSDNVCKGRDIRDDIGDCIVVLVNIAERHGVSITECCEMAYSDIKDRKGKMIDGIFVKESDYSGPDVGWDNRNVDDVV